MSLCQRPQTGDLEYVPIEYATDCCTPHWYLWVILNPSSSNLSHSAFTSSTSSHQTMLPHSPLLPQHRHLHRHLSRPSYHLGFPLNCPKLVPHFHPFVIFEVRASSFLMYFHVCRMFTSLVTSLIFILELACQCPMCLHQRALFSWYLLLLGAFYSCLSPAPPFICLLLPFVGDLSPHYPQSSPPPPSSPSETCSPKCLHCSLSGWQLRQCHCSEYLSRSHSHSTISGETDSSALYCWSRASQKLYSFSCWF